jgi:hypothetical protein
MYVPQQGQVPVRPNGGNTYPGNNEAFDNQNRNANMNNQAPFNGPGNSMGFLKGMEGMPSTLSAFKKN